MHEVTRAINDAADLGRGAASGAVTSVESQHWQIGYVYLPDARKPGTVMPVVSCFGRRALPSVSRALSDGPAYRWRASLPGRVYADGRSARGERRRELQAAAAGSRRARRERRAAGRARPCQSGPRTKSSRSSSSSRTSRTSRARQLDDPDERCQRTDRPRSGARALDRTSRRSRLARAAGAAAHAPRLAGSDADGPRHAEHRARPASAAGRLASRGDRAADRRAGAAGARPGPAACERPVSRGSRRRSLAGHCASSPRPPSRCTRSTCGSRAKHPRLMRTSRGDGAVPHRTGSRHQRCEARRRRARSDQMHVRDGTTSLRVADDGVGIPDPSDRDGVGLRIMHYRAASIGRSLTVERGAGAARS